MASGDFWVLVQDRESTSLIDFELRIVGLLGFTRIWLDLARLWGDVARTMFGCVADLCCLCENPDWCGEDCWLYRNTISWAYTVGLSVSHEIRSVARFSLSPASRHFIHSISRTTPVSWQFFYSCYLFESHVFGNHYFGIFKGFLRDFHLLDHEDLLIIGSYLDSVGNLSCCMASRPSQGFCTREMS